MFSAIPKKDTVFRFEVPLPEDDDSVEENVEGEGEGENDGHNTMSEAKKQNETTEKPKKKPLTFELHGNQFQVRAADRANKKFKWKNMDYI
jgi:ribonuclease P protein subunit POP4